MWAFLILPDCVACDVRKASSWADKLCYMRRAEIEILEALLDL